MHAKWLQSSLTLYKPMECIAFQAYLSMGILQTRILEWIAISSSREIFPTWGRNPNLLCLLHWQAVLHHQQHLGSPIVLQTT